MQHALRAAIAQSERVSSRSLETASPRWKSQFNATNFPLMQTFWSSGIALRSSCEILDGIELAIGLVCISCKETGGCWFGYKPIGSIARGSRFCSRFPAFWAGETGAGAIMVGKLWIGAAGAGAECCVVSVLCGLVKRINFGSQMGQTLRAWMSTTSSWTISWNRLHRTLRVLRIREPWSSLPISNLRLRIKDVSYFRRADFLRECIQILSSRIYMWVIWPSAGPRDPTGSPLEWTWLYVCRDIWVTPPLDTFERDNS